MATIVRAEEEDRKERELAEAVTTKTEPNAEDIHPTGNEEICDKPKDEIDDTKVEEEEELEDEPIKPVKRKTRKKGRRMCNLDYSSEGDDDKDEDFKVKPSRY